MSNEARREAAKEYARAYWRRATGKLYGDFASYDWRDLISFEAGAEWEASRPVSDEEKSVATKELISRIPAPPSLSTSSQDYFDAASAVLEAFVAARRGTK